MSSYEEPKDFYDIDSYDAKQKIKAFKQIDFLRERVLVEVQFGKYAFMFYDLAKFLNSNTFTIKIRQVGIEIVPCYYLHKEMSTGVSYGEQLVDIERLQRNFPSVPIKVIIHRCMIKMSDTAYNIAYLASAYASAQI